MSPSITVEPDPRDRAARLLSVQKNVLEMVALGEPPSRVLHAITQLIEAQGQDQLCSILVLDDSGKHLHCAAADSLPVEYNRAIEGVAIGPCVGSCGTAAYLKRRVVVEDIATDPLWAGFSHLATDHGLLACWSQPIFSRDGTVLGTFAIYYHHIAAPTQQDIELIEMAAHLAGIALERQKIDEALLQAKAAAEQASSLKDQFLAVVSHELRTPLTPVLAMVNLLEGRTDLPAEVRTDLAMIRRNTQLEARLIDDLLDITRIARNKLELRCDAADLHRIIRDAIEICQNDLHTKQQTMTLKLDAKNPHVWVDQARIQQVLWNVLSNALKFTPSCGSIRIETENPPGNPAILVRITDSGIGIEPDILPRLFTAFEQGQRQITRQFGGLGLGLAISKALVEMHGGKLSVASAGKNLGATITLEIPIGQQAQRTPQPAPAAPTTQRKAMPSILLVDDHADTLRTMTRLLKSMGCTVIAASSVAEALQVADRSEFQLLISDLGLPDGTGLDIVHKLKNRGIRSIALSGFGMDEDIRHTTEAGFEKHLIKPVSADLLEQCIRELCG